MNDFLEELARVELTPDEVRAVLRRFAAEEFQTSEKATVLDVSEATGANPEAVMRVLAELRGKPWLEWKREIESSIREHSRRLKALESISRNAPTRAESDVELYERVERGRQEKHAGATAISIGLAVITLIIALAMASPRSPRYPADQWYPGITQTSISGGPSYGFNGQCVWSEEQPNGKPGPITNTQAADEAMMRLTMSQGSLKCPSD